MGSGKAFSLGEMLREKTKASSSWVIHQPDTAQLQRPPTKSRELYSAPARRNKGEEVWGYCTVDAAQPTLSQIFLYTCVSVHSSFPQQPSQLFRTKLCRTRPVSMPPEETPLLKREVQRTSDSVSMAHASFSAPSPQRHTRTRFLSSTEPKRRVSQQCSKSTGDPFLCGPCC